MMVGEEVSRWYKSGPACGGVGSHIDLPLSETRDSIIQGTCVRVPKMKGTAILLLGAATLIAYGSALPYSKIPDGTLESDGYHYKKSTSNSNSNSYSQSNSDESDIDGSFGGQVFSGTKSTGYSTNGASHSQSSSFSSGSFKGQLPIGILASGLPGISQGYQISGSYNQPGYAQVNPGTAGLGLGENGAGSSSKSTVSFGSNSYGGSTTAGNSGQILNNEGETSASYGIPTSGYFAQTGSLLQPGAVQYWWNGANSPFGQDGKPSGGCGTTACTLSGSFNSNKGSGGAQASNQAGQVGVNINSGNPFFSKVPTSGSGSSGFIVTGSTIGEQSASGPSFVSVNRPIDGSKNPFLNGEYSSGSGSFASGSASGSGLSGSGLSGSSGSNSVSFSSFTGAGNPFLKPNSGSFSQETLQGGGVSSTIAPGYAIVTQSPSYATFGSVSSSEETLQNIGPSSTPSPSYVVGSQGSSFSGSSNPFFGSGSFSQETLQGIGPSSTVAPSYTIVSQSPTAIGSLNPFLTSGQKFNEQSTIAPTIYESSSQLPDFGQSQSTIGDNSFVQTSNYFGSSNPFDKKPIFPSESSFPSSQSTINFGSTFPSSYPTQSTLFTVQGTSNTEGSLTTDCSGKGRICVSKNLCINGRVTGQRKDLLQVRTGPQLCNINHEVCCTLEEYSGSSSASFSGSSSGFSGSFTGGSVKPTQSIGSIGSFGQSIGSDQSGSGFSSFGQTGEIGSSGSYDQSQEQESSNFGGQLIGQQPGSDFSQRIPLDKPQRPGSFGISFGQNTFDQSQQKESSNFGSQGTGQTISGFTQGIPSGFSLGTPTPTSGYTFKKPVGGSFIDGAGSDFASASSSASAGTSGQASPVTSGGFVYTSSSPSPSQVTFTNVKQPSLSGGGLFDNSGDDLSNGEQGSPGFSTGIKISSASNGYLPPIGSEPSGQVPSFSLPPKEDEDTGPSDNVPNIKAPSPRPTAFPPAPPVPVQVGCAAALICVEEKFCTMEGVISPEPVALTTQQIERRVPLSSCRNPDNGVIGKCCRDPNYVDPWPTGNLPANYTGGFDEQGFPSYLNYAKTHPPKKPTAPTKNGIRQPTKSFGTTQRPLEKGFTLPRPFDAFNPFLATLPDIPFFGSTTTSERPQIPEEGTSEVLSDQTDDTPASVKPPISSTTPFNLFGFTLPPFPNVNFPSLPSFPQSNGKSSPDSSATNQNSLIIAPHTPGIQCGLRNKVVRPSNLDQDDVAFGEIPWQAMILSTTDRKLLCSGVIVSPNAVLTAAHCVVGLRPDEVSIKSGEWKLGYELKQEEPLPFEIVEVSNIVPHPGYYPDSPSHDLAILFLKHPVALDQHVDIICLGDIPQPKPGRKCISTGWGKTILQVHAAGALMHSIDVDVIPQEACRQRIQGAESPVQIDNTLTCVKAQKQRNNMCQVDVGGPLACDRGDGFYELTGIYSQDTGCLPTNQVATFALIDTNWVKQTLLSPTQVPNINFEVGPPKGEYPSGSNVQAHFESQVTQPAPVCDCQKSYLPPALNQYLPPN